MEKIYFEKEDWDEIIALLDEAENIINKARWKVMTNAKKYDVR